MKKILKLVQNIIKRQINAFKNSNRPEPIFTKVNSPGLKVHIGTGEINLQGWVNIDARNFEHVHIVSNNMQLDEFKEDSIGEIYLCHVLEHISFEEARSFMKLVLSKLKKGGVLRISVPSFDSIIKIYSNNNNNLEIVKYALMGGQDYEYNFHRSVYNLSLLSELLTSNGFGSVCEWTTADDFGQSIGDWSDRNFISTIGPVPISLNVKGLKN
jgi:predicted SAM-dependent methyltransferase